MPVTAAGEQIIVTVSGGCALGLPDDPEDIIRAADACLYRAKADGRNRIVSASPA
jgi:PleD family two-component response regulator